MIANGTSVAASDVERRQIDVRASSEDHASMCAKTGTAATAGKRARIARMLRKASPGYTLIEMLVVLTIISLILGLVGPRVLSYLGESRVKTAKLQIESFTSALDLFYIDAGRYPTDSEGLAALAERPSSVEMWNGPYVKGGRIPADPWGHSYQYHLANDRIPPYVITSLGPDGHGTSMNTASAAMNAQR